MGTADCVIREAAGEIGATESPPGSNRQPYAAEAGHANGQPWCASFVVAMMRRCGVRLPSESPYTPTMAAGFRNTGTWQGRNSDVNPGDVCFFDFPDSVDRIQHVGIVEQATDDTVTCIEGNTSAGSGGSQSNGGGVFRRTRSRSVVVGFGRPLYSGGHVEEVEDMTPEQAQQLQAVAAAMEALVAAAARNDTVPHGGAATAVVEWEGGTYVAVCGLDGVLRIYVHERGQGWREDWSASNCDPTGGVAVQNHLDGALHLTCRRQLGHGAVRIVKPAGQHWRAAEIIGG